MFLKSLLFSIGTCFPVWAGSLALTPCEVEIALQHEGKTIRMAQEMLNLADLALFTCPHPVTSLTCWKLPWPEKSPHVDEIVKDFLRIEALGFASTLLEKKCFYARCKFFLDRWRIIYNLTEQEIYPCDVKEMTHLLRGYSLIRTQVDCSQRAQFDRWLQGVADGLIQTECDDLQMLEKAYRLSLVGQIGYLLGDSSLVAYATTQYEEILDCTPVPHVFSSKSQVLHEVSLLNPLLQLACASARNEGALYDYQSPNGSSLCLRVIRLLPYLAGRQFHLFPGYEPARAILEQAAYFDKDLLEAKINGHSWQSLDGYLNTLHFRE